MEFLDSWKDGIFNILRRQETESPQLKVILIKIRSRREFIKSEYIKKHQDIIKLDDYDLRSFFITSLKSNAKYKCTEMKIELGTFKIKEDLNPSQTNEINEEVEKCDETIQMIKTTVQNCKEEARKRRINLSYLPSSGDELVSKPALVPSDQPMFQGGILPNFHEWRFEMELWFKSSRVPIEEQGKYILKSVEGPARRVLKDLYPNEAEAEELFKTLKENFGGRSIMRLTKKYHTEYGVIPNQISDINSALESTQLHLRLLEGAKYAGAIYNPEEYAAVLTAILPPDERTRLYRIQRSMTMPERLKFIEENLRSLRDALTDEIHHGGAREEGDGKDNAEQGGSNEERDEIFQSNDEEEEVQTKPSKVQIKPSRFRIKKTNCTLCRGENKTKHAILKNGSGRGIPETCQKIRGKTLERKKEYVRLRGTICEECLGTHRGQEYCNFLLQYPFFKCRVLHCSSRFSLCPDHANMNKEKLETTKEQFEDLNLDFCILSH